jgi:hypothetical protein
MSNYLQRIQDIQSRAASARRQVESLEAELGGQKATEAFQGQEKKQEDRENYLNTIKDHIENYQARFQDVMGLGAGVAGTAKALKKYRLANLQKQAAAARQRGAQNPETESGTGQTEGTTPQPDRNPADRADRVGTEDQSISGDELATRLRALPPEGQARLAEQYSNLPDRPTVEQASEFNTSLQREESLVRPQTEDDLPPAPEGAGAGEAEEAARAGRAAVQAGRPPIQDEPPAPRPDTNELGDAAGDTGGSQITQQSARQGASEAEQLGTRTAAETTTQTGTELGTELGTEAAAEAGLSAIPVVGEIAMVIGGIADLIQGVTGEGALDAAKKKLAEQPAIQNIQQSGVVTSGFDASALTK